MLLGNVTVGKKILQHFPTFALLRRHPAPPPQNFDWLIASAAAVGVEIDISSSKRLSETLDAARVDGKPYFQTLLRIMATRCMTRALYFCTGYVEQAEYLHYGLAAPIYTHFTSPIRRYADVVVHRLLAAALRYTPVPALLEDKSSIHEICDIINKRNHAAQLASRGSNALHTLLYFKDREVREDAMVMKVRSNGFIALIPRYGIEGIVYVQSKTEAATWVLSEDGQVLIGPNGAEIRVFDSVPVLISAPPDATKLDIKLVAAEVGRTAQLPADINVTHAALAGREGANVSVRASDSSSIRSAKRAVPSTGPGITANCQLASFALPPFCVSSC
jgi:exosome complex exonuclease DIS3/RRP44